MPGPVIHHMIADEILSKIKNGDFFQEEDDLYRELLSDPESMYCFYLGCQGPDFLFFHATDWNEDGRKLAKLFIDILELIEEIRNSINKVVPKEAVRVLRDYERITADIADKSATAGQVSAIFGDAKKAIDGILALIRDRVIDLVTNEINPFDTFDHPYRDGIKRPKDWWYFDALHYRHTGSYAATLLKNATSVYPKDKKPLLYALGYLSHFSADVVGHPYVNINSGAPFRNASQRHKVAENFHDSFTFRDHTKSRNVDMNSSALHNFYFKGLDNSKLLPTPKFDESLFHFIASSINEVYQVDVDEQFGPDFGRPVTDKEIRSAVELWLIWFRSTTETGTLPPPEPYELTEELRRVYEQARQNLREIGGEFGNQIDNARGSGLWGIFLALLAAIMAAVATAVAILDGLIASAIAIQSAPIRAAFALIYEHLYDAWQNFRLALALKGLAYPLQNHLNHPQAKQFHAPDRLDSSGRSAERLKDNLPLLGWPLNLQRSDGTLGPRPPFEKHLLYAPLHWNSNTGTPHGELPLGTIVAPSVYFSAPPSLYAFGPMNTVEGVLNDIMLLQRSGEPEDGDVSAITSLLHGNEPILGDAVSLTRSLFYMWRRNEIIPDFNLDSDRGYGFLCFTQPQDLSSPNKPTRIVTQPDKGENENEARQRKVKIQWIREQPNE